MNNRPSVWAMAIVVARELTAVQMIGTHSSNEAKFFGWSRRRSDALYGSLVVSTSASVQSRIGLSVNGLVRHPTISPEIGLEILGCYGPGQGRRVCLIGGLTPAGTGQVARCSTASLMCHGLSRHGQLWSPENRPFESVRM